MKKIIFLTALLCLAASCSQGPKKEEGPSAKEVMTGYADTLAKAPPKARDVAGREEQRNAAEEKAIKELEK